MANKLQIVDYTKLSFWDFETLNKKKAFNSKYPTVKLKEVVSLRKKFFLIDDQQIYKRCRVQLYGNGVLLRDQVKGEEIKTKRQQACFEEDFIVAEIDAKFGGYGIIPKELTGAIVSSHYFLFEINRSKLLPSFLELLLRTDEFANQVKATGSTNYAAIRPHHVLEYEIPLPDLLSQHLLVSSIHQIHTSAESLAQKALQQELNANRYLFGQLGITFNDTAAKRERFSVVDLIDVERWSVDFFRDQQVLHELKRSSYPLIKLKQLMNSLQYGLSLKAENVNTGIPMLRMNNLKRGKLDLEQLKYLNVSVNQIRNYVLDKGDLLINRTNSKELVGKTAVFDQQGTYTFASYLIRIKLNQRVADVNYINYVFNSDIGRRQIDLVSRQVAGQANINSTEIQNLMFPIPDLGTQRAIVEALKQMDAVAVSAQAESMALKDKALRTFKESLFL